MISIQHSHDFDAKACSVFADCVLNSTTFPVRNGWPRDGRKKMVVANTDLGKQAQVGSRS